jgi:hypothetical protein
MEYKVITITRKSDCCNPPASLWQEIQNACNEMSSQNFALIAIYPEDFLGKDCCYNATLIHGAVLVFGRKR